MHGFDSTPGFRLYTDNDLNKLASSYIHARRKFPGRFRKKDFMAGEKICVATRGMSIWLEHYMVEAGQMVANVSFPFIRNVIDSILSGFMAGNGAYRPELFEEEVLVWRIYRLLDIEKLKKEASLDRLVNYLQAETCESGVRENRRWQLALKLAQLYYDYMAFVPEKLEWGEGVAEGDIWQIKLWNMLRRDKDGRDMISPSRAMLDFISSDNTLPPDFHEPVTFFGISAMAPYFLRVLNKLSTVQPVNFFYLNHCDELWDDARAHFEYKTGEPELLDSCFKNTLLGNLGMQGREFFKAVIDLDGVLEQENMDWQENEREDEVSPCERSLLNDIQYKIKKYTDAPTEGKLIPSCRDDSLTVHNCSNDVRQVEVLHDCILRLLQEYGKDITMNDIIVMSPDISRFATVIRTVFDKGPLKNRYCISDRSVKSANMMAEAFLNIISMYKGRFEMSRIDPLLDSQPLLKKMGMDEEDVMRIRNWFAKSGIKWGRDGGDREEFGGFEEFSWQHGMDRMLLKFALDGFDESGQPAWQFAGLDPMDIGTGKEGQRLMNGLCSLLRKLKKLTAAVEKEGRSGVEWCDLLLETRDDFFQADSEDYAEYSALGASIGKLRDAFIKAGINEDEEMPFDVILSAMKSSMEAPAAGEPFLNGRITFCSLLPMRGIPCRVIALLGMEAGEFPRMDDRTGYNLVSRNAAGGRGNLLKYYDRLRSVEDRFTFLEAMMSAGDYLMIFYNGMDGKTGQELPAAAPVEELLSYVQGMSEYGENKNVCCIKHSLNSFDAGNFGALSEAGISAGGIKEHTGALLRQFSYDQDMKEIADELSEKEVGKRFLWHEAFSLPLPAELPHGWQNGAEVSFTIEDLCRFLENPARSYMVGRMGFPSVNRKVPKLTDFEPFSISEAGGYSLKETVGLESVKMDEISLLPGDSGKMESIYREAVGKGRMPIGEVGRRDFAKMQMECWVADNRFRSEWRKQEESGEVQLDIPLGNIALKPDDELADILARAAESAAEAGGNCAFELPDDLPVFKVRLTGSVKYFDGEDSAGLRHCFFYRDIQHFKFIPFYLKHLLFCAGMELGFISRKTVRTEYRKLPNEDSCKINASAEDISAVERLGRIVKCMMLGQLYPLPLFGKASLGAFVKGKDLKIEKDMQDWNTKMLFESWNEACPKNAAAAAEEFGVYCYGKLS